MSNSGTLTSCFADFNRFPIPAFLASKSPSSFMDSSTIVFGVVLSGDALLVGGSDEISISIIIDDRRRRAGSSGNIDRRKDIGLGGWAVFCWYVECAFDASGKSRAMVDGRSKDHDRTKSSART